MGKCGLFIYLLYPPFHLPRKIKTKCCVVLLCWYMASAYLRARNDHKHTILCTINVGWVNPIMSSPSAADTIVYLGWAQLVCIIEPRLWLLSSVCWFHFTWVSSQSELTKYSVDFVFWNNCVRIPFLHTLTEWGSASFGVFVCISDRYRCRGFFLCICWSSVYLLGNVYIKGLFFFNPFFNCIIYDFELFEFFTSYNY